MPNDGYPYILHHIDQEGRVVRSNQDVCEVCIYWHEDVYTQSFDEAPCRHIRPLTANLQPTGSESYWCVNGAFEYIDEENDNARNE